MTSQEFSNSKGMTLRGFVSSGLCYFGFWNSSNTRDLEAQKELFSQFESWARGQGFHEVFGPIDGSTLGMYRLRLNAFDQPGFWGEPANSQEPIETLKSLGYDVREKYYSYVCHRIEKLRPLMKSLEEKIPKTALSDLRFEKLRMEKWSLVEDQIREVANEIFAKNFAFSPMSKEDFSKVYSKPVLEKVCQDTSMLVWADQRLVGFCVNFKDAANPERVLIKTAGVIEPYRRMGLTFFEMIRQVFESQNPYRSAILCLMREGNVPALFLKDFADEVREYGLFSKKI